MEKLLEKLNDKGCKNTLTYNLNSDINFGIVFLYSIWSPTLNRFTILSDSLNHSPQFQTIPIYVFNIDSEEYKAWSTFRNIKSHGYGELFWIKSGEIMKDITTKGDLDRNTLINNHLILLADQNT